MALTTSDCGSRNPTNATTTELPPMTYLGGTDQLKQQVALQPHSLRRTPTAAVSSCRSWPYSCNPQGEPLLQL